MENTIKGDKLDEMKYENEVGKQISPEVKKYMEKLKTVNKLAEDVWRGLYKYRPVQVPREEVSEGYELNWELTDKMQGLKEYKMLREYTQLDDVASTVATCSLLKNLIENIPEDKLKQLNNSIQAISDMKNEMDRLQNQIEGLKAMGGDQNRIKDLQNRVKDIQQKIQNQQNNLQTGMQKMGQNLRSALRRSLKDAMDETKEVCDIIGWGTEQGGVQRLSYEDKIKIALLIQKNKTIREVAKIVGRMKLLLYSKQKQKINKVPEEVVDIVMGDDLMRTIPSDMMLMMESSTEPLFARKFTEKQLLQYDLEGREKQGEGPIIICVDNSGSMAGEKEVWSKAVACALWDFAIKKKRVFAVIHFGAEDEYKIYIVPPNMPVDERLKTMIDMLTYFNGGGTDFETPLKQAIKLIQQNEFKKADIVFISDDACEVRENFLADYKKIKKEKEFKAIGISIGVGYKTMEKFCDVVIPVEKLATDDVKVASELFENI